MTTLEEMKRNLLEKSSGNIISTMGEEPEKDWLVSPALDLNRILSGSLYKSAQVGNHIAFIGPEMSGKSSIIALLLADAQKKGYLPVVINCEGSWNNDFCTRWGLDPNNIVTINSLWVDEVTPKLAEFVENKFENLAIAIDSLGSMELRKLVDDGVGGDVKADQGRLQKDIKRMLKMIVGLCKFQNCIAFSAGHWYGSPSIYSSPEEIGGGKYYRLSADVMVSLKKNAIYENPTAKSKDKKGKVLGNKITAATLKNRAYPPFQEATVEIDYKNGVNEMAGLIDVGIDIELIKQSGAWYSMDGERLGQGAANVTENLKQPELKKSFLEKIETYLETTGYSSVNRNLELQQEDSEQVNTSNNDSNFNPGLPETEKSDEGSIESKSAKKKKGPGRPKKK